MLRNVKCNNQELDSSTCPRLHVLSQPRQLGVIEVTRDNDDEVMEDSVSFENG